MKQSCVSLYTCPYCSVGLQLVLLDKQVLAETTVVKCSNLAGEYNVFFLLADSLMALDLKQVS